MRASLTPILFSLVLASPISASAGDTGAVTGHIKVKKVARPAPLAVTANPEVCGKDPVPNETLVIGKGGALANVVLSVNAGGTPAPGEARVKQERCRYLPHVQAVSVGSSLEITNGDSVLHTVHGLLGADTLFNWAMPFKGHKLKGKLDKAGAVALKCDAGHTWMSAHIVVLPTNLFAVSRTDGTFRIEGVPVGTHTLKLWHETLGEKTAEVTVTANGEAKLDVTW